MRLFYSLTEIHVPVFLNEMSLSLPDVGSIKCRSCNLADNSGVKSVIPIDVNGKEVLLSRSLTHLPNILVAVSIHGYL